MVRASEEALVYKSFTTAITMNIFALTEMLARKMKWYDFSLLKASVFFFTLFLLTVWDGFRIFVLGVHWYWYLVLAVIVTIPLLKKMFSELIERKSGDCQQGSGVGADWKD